MLEKIKYAGEAREEPLLGDGKFGDLDAKGIVSLLEEGAKTFIVFDVEEGSQVRFESTGLVAKDEYLRS